MDLSWEYDTFASQCVCTCLYRSTICLTKAPGIIRSKCMEDLQIQNFAVTRTSVQLGPVSSGLLYCTKPLQTPSFPASHIGGLHIRSFVSGFPLNLRPHPNSTPLFVQSLVCCPRTPVLQFFFKTEYEFNYSLGPLSGCGYRIFV